MLSLKPTHLFKHCSSLLQQRLYCSPTWSHEPNDFNYLNHLLSNQISSLKTLLQSHAFIITSGYSNNIFIASKLISLYASFHKPSCSTELFDEIPHRDAFLWNSIIKAHFSNGEYSRALDFYQWMRASEALPNHFTIPMIVASCAELELVNYGRSIHGLVSKLGLFSGNQMVQNALLSMYCKFGFLKLAEKFFGRVNEQNFEAWNLMFSFCEDLKPNSATLVSVLSACSHLASLEEGEKVHNYINGGKFEFNLSIATALIDMYAKCGQLEKSREIFNSMHERDVITWNVMISGYGMHGDARSAIEFFQQMEESSAKPNGLTFLAVLSACAHAGLVKEGKYLFGKMQDYSVAPNLKHYACMVDLLGRSGNLQEAEALVLSMPISPDGGVWGALLSSCKIHNEIEMGIRIAKHAIDSDVENDGYYVMISNMYSSIGKWEEAEKARGIMKERGVRKKTGWSAV
ncbi:unnamed protein product, partial [Vitis vinifera]